MKFNELLAFRNDLFFDGAVQADWFYRVDQSKKVAESFVFHGPNTHAVKAENPGQARLIDTASFVNLLADKICTDEPSNPLTLAIAGYGTGKSHLAVALSELFSGPRFHEDTYAKVVSNIKRADITIGKSIETKVKKPNLVLTLNGVNNFDLHYELLRTAQKALSLYGESDSVMRSLDQAHEVAMIFLNKNFENMQPLFEKAASNNGISILGSGLKEYLNTTSAETGSFNTINSVYKEINGHEIRWDEGVSAKQILQTLLRECCGNFGNFEKIVILFDEFGRFLEYASANPGKAGDSALQQIFEAVQNAEGAIQFVGFIQADIKAYLQRVDNSANVSRYIDRFDASEKVYLSSNLETIFANLIEKLNEQEYQRLIGGFFDSKREYYAQMHKDVNRWLPMKGVWRDESTFNKIIARSLYPLHPITTYLLTALTEWLQNRSSLTLLNEKFSEMASMEVSEVGTIPIIYPTDILKGNFFLELLNAEEQGRQRSQICILYNTIIVKYGSKLTALEQEVLLANVILRVCRFTNSNRQDTIQALTMCTPYSDIEVCSALEILENEYAILEYDSKANCFDFVADAVGANEFRRFIKQKSREIVFRPGILEQNEVVRSFAKIDDPIETTFGDEHGIQSHEWEYEQQIVCAEHITDETFERYINGWKKATSTDQPKGRLIWVYFNKETPSSVISGIQEKVGKYLKNVPVIMMALNDASNVLAESIVDFLAYSGIDDTSKKKYERFYEDGLAKATIALESQFDALKRERLVFSKDGIRPAEQRMAKYLASLFKSIYTHPVPFDFENFKNKNLTKGKKNYCTIAKLLANNSSEHTYLAQTGEIKSRVDSLLRIGPFSWKALSTEYVAIAPQNSAAYYVYSMLDEKLLRQNYLNFGVELENLCLPPYGMNQHSAVLMLMILALNEGYQTKLVLGGTKYNPGNWSTEVIGESKIDLKQFAATRLTVVNVAAAQQKYISLFKKIDGTSNVALLIEFKKNLEDLSIEEEMPDELVSQSKLAKIKLSNADSVLKKHNQTMDELITSYNIATEHGNVASVMKVMSNVHTIPKSYSVSGMIFELSDEHRQKIEQLQAASKAYIDKYIDKWLPDQKCESIADMDRYEKRMRKVISTLDSLGYEAKARTAVSLMEHELENVARLRRRAKIMDAMVDYSQSTQRITKNASLLTLDEAVRAGQTLFNEMADFKKAEFSSRQLQIIGKAQKELDRISALYESRTAEMNAVWDDLYEARTLNDLRTISTRMMALLNAGVPEKDRTDMEDALAFVNNFITDIDSLNRLPDSRTEIESMENTLESKYDPDNSEFDLTSILHEAYEGRITSLNAMEEKWAKQHIQIELEKMSADALNAWKRQTAVLPAYLSMEMRLQVQAMIPVVESELSRKRVAYITSLINELNAQEKKQVVAALKMQ